MKDIKVFKLVALLLIGTYFSCSEEDAIPVPNKFDSEDYYQDKEVEIVFENDRERGINIVFMGDGYFHAELEKSNSKYRKDALKSIQYVFNSHPFIKYKEHFNAYIVYAKSYIKKNKQGIVSHYPFGSAPKEIPGRNVAVPVIEKHEAIDDYYYKIKGRNRSGNDLIIMATNSFIVGTGTGGANLAVFGTRAKSSSDQTKMLLTMLHEVGHAFASLGDEYIEPGLYLNATKGIANLDSTSDLNLIKWKHFIELEKYPQVGVFEGGGYREFGTWRPEFTSIMSSIGGFTQFNTPSREAIVKKIMSLRGLTYNFDAFLDLDASFQQNTHSKSTLREGDKAIICGQNILESYKN